MNVLQWAGAGVRRGLICRSLLRRAAAVALYWHFLAAIWLCLFVGLLFWP